MDVGVWIEGSGRREALLNKGLSLSLAAVPAILGFSLLTTTS
jgi:hypothetical protein